MAFVGFADQVLTGGGKKPSRLVWWFLGAWLLNMLVFSYSVDKMAPNNVPLLQNDKLRACVAATSWTRCKLDALNEYPKFYPWLYALDVLVPIMDLQQSRFWQPISGDGGRGTFAFFWRCLAGAFGWLLGVALVSVATRFWKPPEAGTTSETDGASPSGSTRN